MTRRLLLANLSVLLVLLLTLEVPLALVYSRHEHDTLEAEIQSDAAALAALATVVAAHPDQYDAQALVQRLDVAPGEVVMVIDANGNELTPPGLLSNDAEIAAVLDQARTGTTVTGELDDLVYVAVPFDAAGDAHGAVIVGRPDDAVDARVRRLWFGLVALGLIVLAVAALVTSRVSRWVLDPLRRLERQAAALGGGALHARVDPTTGPPEARALATTFNQMAERLDELITSQRRFVADASHQLRSPLTGLRLRLENLEDASSPNEILANREAALAETARLTRLVDGLLALARAEGQRPGREPVAVGTVMSERRDMWRPLAAERGIDLMVVGDAGAGPTASMVPGHLEQVLDNLIDNAIDASPAGTTVTLSTVVVGDTIDIHVTDHGRGMSDDDRARALSPFWQGASGDSGGSAGLGLAIVDQLARANGGVATLHETPGGGVDAVARVERRL
jgi:signal transduction histidine kinase